MNGAVIIRKGSVRLMPGELSVLPSHMSGDAVLIRAKEKVGEILNSMSHGTGRKMAWSECKPFADGYDSSLRTDGPFAYRDLDECLGLIAEYVEVVARFGVIGYMGHLG